MLDQAILITEQIILQIVARKFFILYINQVKKIQCIEKFLKEHRLKETGVIFYYLVVTFNVHFIN